MIFRLFSPHGHGQCKAMRYISKHEADVYLDKEEKHRADWGLRKRPWLLRFLQMSSLDYTTMEPIPVLAQCCGMVLYLFCFSLFLIENPDATFFSPQVDKNKEIDNNPKQPLLVKTTSREIYFSLKWNLKNKTTWIITSNMSRIISCTNTCMLNDYKLKQPQASEL